WIEATHIDEHNVARQLSGDGGVDAVIVPGGFGSRGVEGKILCARHCRHSGLPYLGICLGFQVAVIDFARDVLGIENADSTEFIRRDASGREIPITAVISELPEQKKIEGLGGSMRLGAQD